MVAALSAADVAVPELVTGHGVKLAPVELCQLDSAKRVELVGAMQAMDDDTQGAIADGGVSPAFAVRGGHCKH